MPAVAGRPLCGNGDGALTSDGRIRKLLFFVGIFALAYLVPVEAERVRNGLTEAFAMLHEYAREHVLLCLIPAFFIAGAIGVFLGRDSVMKYLGAKANRVVAYSVAAVSGTVLAVCSCTVLPLFAGIYMRGAGLGPATAFLYSGPAINVLAIILTARVLGPQLGVARAVGAIGLAFVVGLLMQLLFRREELERAAAQDDFVTGDEVADRPLWRTGLYFAAMVAILVFANWGKPSGVEGAYAAIHGAKWAITGVLALALMYMLARWFDASELRKWTESTWGFAEQILPLLFAGVLVAGLLLGRPGHEGLVPSEWIAGLVGGNSLGANLFAAISGAFMYFATLTEIPILQGLLGSGMGQGPALALLLAGPALSLPSMLVINSILGPRKTIAYVSIVVVLSTAAGWVYGGLVT